MNLLETVAYLAGELRAPRNNTEKVLVNGVSSIDKAKCGDITFLAHPKYKSYLKGSQAAVIIVKSFEDTDVPQIKCEHPYLAFVKMVEYFHKAPQIEPGIADSALVSPSAVIHQSAAIMANVVVSDGVVVGARSLVMPGCYLGRNVLVGEDCVVHPNCVIGYSSEIGDRVIIHGGTVIGADGFGYVPYEGEIKKIPQVGNVVVESDVEIGGSVTIDRAALESTIIGQGSKLDSQVHVGHNALIGKNCILSGNTSIAGSAVLGDWVVTGGQAGVAGHLQVGDGCMIGAMTGVIKDAKAAETYLGFPATPAKEWRRRQVYLKRLPEMSKKMRELEKKVDELLSLQST